jgi:hypothetical protein
MSLETEPFVRYHEEKKKDTFTVTVNVEERKNLEEIKEVLNIKSDSRALKIAAWIGQKALLSTFGTPILTYLFKKDRQKLEDFKNF